MTASLDTTISRNGDILYAAVGGEQAVMMSVQAGMYYGLNAVGSRLWELLETPHTIAELCERICEEFEVDAETCRTEILKFTDDLLANGVVHANPA